MSLRPQADETAEALDAAAVEAALSLCEENGHDLSGAWDAGPFHPHESHPAVPSRVPHSLQSSLEGRTEVLAVHDRTSASFSSLCNSSDNCLATFPVELRGLAATSSTSFNSKRLENCYIGTPPQRKAARETRDTVHQRSQILSDVNINRKSKKWAQQRCHNNHGGIHAHA